MGSQIKQMLKKRARDAKKKALSDIRSIGRSKVYIFAKPDGTPLLGDEQKKGEEITVTWCFSSAEKAEATLGEIDAGLEVVLSETNVSEFLGSLFHHLGQSDIDILKLDGVEIPLTTIGVRLLDTEDNDWDVLLKQARETPHANVLLAQVAITVLEASSGEKVTGTYADLVRMLMGKQGRFPVPDLGIVWMLASAVEDGTEPVFLKLADDSPDNASGSDLAVGPMFFTNYQYAMNWPKVLPPNVAAHLAEMKLILLSYRAMGLLEEVNDNFPTATVDERKPDVFLIDGGCLPMTLAGARYTDELAYGDDKPENCFTTLAEKDEVELRKATVTLLARSVGIQLVPTEPTPQPPEEA